MSTLSRMLSHLAGAIMPRRCPICGAVLQQGHRYLCTSCLADAPLTNLWLDDESVISQRIRALRPEIVIASSLIYYVREAMWRESIHRLKYSGEWRFCIRYGEWLGSILRDAPLYQEVDCVVAVPLHPLRQMERGYNQSEYIAHGVAKAMGVEHIRGALRRKRYNKAQVTMSRDDRWENVEGLFRVTSPKRLTGRNILIVDDVFTTGATILSCAEEILDGVAESRIWIATIAVSTREMGM